MMKRVEYTPLHYDTENLGAIIAFLSVIAYENPQMFDEILCRVAMGVGGFRTILTTTENHAKRIQSLEVDMSKALEKGIS